MKAAVQSAICVIVAVRRAELRGGSETAQLVEKIEDQDDSVRRRLPHRARGDGESNPRSIRMEIEHAIWSAPLEAPFGPDDWRRGTERSVALCITHHHQLAIDSVHQLRLCARPAGQRAAIGRYLPLAAGARKRPHVN